jgi:peptide chain release factor 1
MIDREHIARLSARLPQIEAQLSDPATAANQKKFRELVREHVSLRKLEEIAARYFRVLDQLQENRRLLEDEASEPDLKDLAAGEVADLDAKLPAAEKELILALAPPDPNGERSAIMEIRAGAGGDEAALFAGDLFRMYSRYAAGKGWKIGMIDASPSEIGGFKDVVFSVEGAAAFGTLCYESGVHRVQRVPVTEAAGRIHTSTSTVAVFPEAEAEDDIEVKPDEIRVDVFCSSGPGGQSVNTTYSAVRITHLPTGLVAQSQDERSQHRNREKALAVLKARILDMRRHEEESKKGSARRSQIGTGERSEKIRTYNFPQNRLTDHRINLSLHSLDRIMEGDLDHLIAALAEHDTEQRLRQGVLEAGDKPRG